MNKPFLYAHFNESSYCDIHRLLYPIRYTGEDFPELDFNLSVTDPSDKFHYYMTHGCPPFNNLQYIGQWKRGGGKWILSLDDDFDSVPEWNPARLSEAQLNVYHLTLSAADVILSSTPHLTKAIKQEHKTITAPNLLDVQGYGVPQPPMNNGKIRILWAGSRTHRKDLEILEEPIDYLIPKYKDKIEFVFVGSAPDKAIQKYVYKGLHYEKGVPPSVYMELMHTIKPHIVLAPLCDVPFNYSKSNIRVLEGWALSAAVVASPVGEYNVIKEGVDGEYARTSKEWIDKLELLINSTAYREGVAINGHNRALTEFDWSNKQCRKPWHDFINKLKQLI